MAGALPPLPTLLLPLLLAALFAWIGWRLDDGERLDMGGRQLGGRCWTIEPDKDE